MPKSISVKASLIYTDKIILKGDQEAAIESVLQEIAKKRQGAETLVEFSPVRDSSSNGLAEKGIQTFEALLRTHLIDIDEKLGERMPLDQPWFHWLVEHCADMPSELAH